MNSKKPVMKQRSVSETLLSKDSMITPVLQRIYSARNIQSLSEVEYALNKLLPPGRITNLTQAAKLLAQHVQNQSPILIFGDYDADGATSTALCVRALNAMGHQKVDFLLPDRFTDGYGLSENVSKRVIEAHPKLVITVDTGIASMKGVDLLRQQNIDVIVTDHHLPADELPAANHIVNPNAFADSEGKNLAGVGVAFYLMLALRSELREKSWFDSHTEPHTEPNLADCLDLVAIGTVADLVPLDFYNRLLVSEGLKRLRAGACSLGIKKLIELSRKNIKNLSSQDIAFSVAPRINAAGRLDDMTIGVQTLLANEEKSAIHLAYELDNMNQLRKELQGQMTQQAMSMLPDLTAGLESQGHQRSVVMFQPDWHEGIVGIIASKIKDITYLPSISFAQSESGELKGSGRSIAGVHLRDMLDLVNKKYPEMILRFGGHAMAAGLSILPQQLDQFRDAFEQVLQQYIDANCFNNVVEHDGSIESSYLNIDLARAIRESGPWGQKFPLPSFWGEFKVINQKVLADRHLKFSVTPLDKNQPVDAILFSASDEQLKTNYQSLNIHYELNINEFRNAENLQLLIRHIG